MQHTLKAARKRKQLSVSELARRAECDRATVQRLERGKNMPRWDVARRLETALDLEPGSLKFQKAS
jgi:transcriptional regulator with XRE-family HTH domain